MVRHSHHHVPAHIGGVRYVPPCCGCGGINRQKQAREIAEKKAQRKAGFEHLQNLQQAVKREPIPKHVREMAGIKIKQQLAKDTVSFSQMLQQKGVSKEKALEKLLDKLVGMYNSEKELMKALKNLEINKLLELLRKALSTVNETTMEKEDANKKKVEKSTNKAKVTKVIEKESNEENETSQDDEEQEADHEEVLALESAETPSEQDSLEIKAEKEPSKRGQTKNKSNKTENVVPSQGYKIDIRENQVKFSGNTYSIEAKNLLKEQSDIEIAQIRREMIFEKNSKTDDISENTDSENAEKQETKEHKLSDNKRLDDLEKENKKLKKIILELEKERRAELISKDFRD